MNKSLFKYKGHEIVFSGTDYGDVRDSDKCRLCGCSWGAAEMLYECEGVSMNEDDRSRMLRACIEDTVKEIETLERKRQSAEKNLGVLKAELAKWEMELSVSKMQAYARGER